jgi:hypothetical protein
MHAHFTLRCRAAVHPFAAFPEVKCCNATSIIVHKDLSTTTKRTKFLLIMNTIYNSLKEQPELL